MRDEDFFLGGLVILYIYMFILSFALLCFCRYDTMMG